MAGCSGPASGGSWDSRGPHVVTVSKVWGGTARPRKTYILYMNYK